jgi:cob(I)alamin adenosyltransferase
MDRRGYAPRLTARAVADHHFDAVYEAYLEDPAVRDFLAENNPAALGEIAERLLEAQDRGLWRPRSNSAHAGLLDLAGIQLEEGRPMSDRESEAERNLRADEKSRKRKAARDKMLATKTKEKGLLIVHTGKGKGKSTAAFGLAVRAIGNGLRVGVVQYVKGKWETGERGVLERFPDQVEIRTMGEGFTWDTQDRARDIAAAKAAWEASKEMIEACRADPPKFDLVVLDELNIVLRYDYLPLEEVVAFLAARPKDLHVVVTGRNAKPELIEAADLVTEMTMIKHPFRDQGVKAQKGIEF